MLGEVLVLTFMVLGVSGECGEGTGDSDGDDSECPSGYGTVVRVRRKAADLTLLWPDAVVPYTFLAPEPERGVVLKGVQHWEQHTCLRFLPVNDTQLPHLQFRKLAGCRSGVGIEAASGQNISIGDNCNKVGIVVHEIGHAIGFYHEIRRPDRDDHVVVNENNILKNELFNFYKLHWLDVSIKYDLSSVMHYHTLEWTANERTTVATRDPTLQGLIGLWKQESSRGLSHRDKLLANTVYGCLDQWLAQCNLNRNPCENEGYLDQACTCVCPPGTTGRTCQIITGGYYDHLKSPCSQDVTYPTILTSPDYPNNYDPDTWCVYRLEAPECQAPQVEVLDFQLGPRDMRDQCYHDYLEIRNDSLYDGFLKCGTDVTLGTRWTSSSRTMILYFKGAEGGYRGFKVEVRFTSIPGCCTTSSNTSSIIYLHTPGYPRPYTQDFYCKFSLPAEAPAKVVVKVDSKGGAHTAHPWTCTLKLCQPNGKCRRYCGGVGAKVLRGARGQQQQQVKVVLPNTASIHHLSYKEQTSFFDLENAAYQISFTLQESPCHKILIVNRSDPRGWVSVGPSLSKVLQCEWWIQAPRGSHVKVSVEALHLEGEEDSTYLVVNEAGGGTYEAPTSRVYDLYHHNTPPHFVSLQHKMSLVLQGTARTTFTFKYDLYECQDEDAECEYWAVNDECVKNPLWMLEHCRESCLRCDYSTVCEDGHTDCQFWAKHDQCQENRLWMNVHCRQACGYCDKCWDANHGCAEWTSLGECENNPDYMSRYCRKSCGLCAEEEEASNSTSIEPLMEVETTTSTFTSSTNITTSLGRRPFRPPQHPYRKFSNRTRVTTTPPDSENFLTTHPEENDTTKKILKPVKGKRIKPSKPSTTRYSQPPSRETSLMEHDEIHERVKPRRSKQKSSSFRSSKDNESTKQQGKGITPRAWRQDNKSYHSFNSARATKKIQVSSTRETMVTTASPTVHKTAANLPSRKTRHKDGSLTKHSFRNQSERSGPVIQQNMTLVTSLTGYKGIHNLLTADRLIPASLTADRLSAEAQKMAGDKTTSLPLQDSHNMSSGASEKDGRHSHLEETDKSSYSSKDPTRVYKSQGIYEEPQASPTPSAHRRTCVGGEGERCGRSGRRDPGVHDHLNNKETQSNSILKSQQSKVRAWKGRNDVVETLESSIPEKEKLDKELENRKRKAHRKHKRKNKRKENRVLSRKKKKTNKKRGRWRGDRQPPGQDGSQEREMNASIPRRRDEAEEKMRDNGRINNQRRRNKKRKYGRNSRKRGSSKGRPHSSLNKRTHRDKTSEGILPVFTIQLPSVTTHSPPTVITTTAHSPPTTILLSPVTTQSPGLIINRTYAIPEDIKSWNSLPSTPTITTTPRTTTSTTTTVTTIKIPSTGSKNTIRSSTTLTTSTSTTTSARTMPPVSATLTVSVTPTVSTTPATEATLITMASPSTGTTLTSTRVTMPSITQGQRADKPTRLSPHHTTSPASPKSHPWGIEMGEDGISPTIEATAATQRPHTPTVNTLTPAPSHSHTPTVNTLTSDKHNKPRKYSFRRRRLPEHGQRDSRNYSKHKPKKLNQAQLTNLSPGHHYDQRESLQQKEFPSWKSLSSQQQSHQVTARPLPDASPGKNITQRRNPNAPRQTNIPKPSSVASYNLRLLRPAWQMKNKVISHNQRALPGHIIEEAYLSSDIDERLQENMHPGDQRQRQTHPGDQRQRQTHPGDQRQRQTHTGDQRQTEMHFVDQEKTKMEIKDEGKTKMQVEDEGTEHQATRKQPPRRSPERYADWGIGPLTPSLHSLERSHRPGWKFRRDFYLRGYIYEDIWSPSHETPARPGSREDTATSS